MDGRNGVSLQQWTEATSKDFADFKQEMGRVVNYIRTAGGPGQAGGWTTRGRGILESKVWSGVKTLATDNNISYNEWHAQLKNAYFQARPGTRN